MRIRQSGLRRSLLPACFSFLLVQMPGSSFAEGIELADACDLREKERPSIRDSIKSTREKVNKICVEPKSLAQGQMERTLARYCKSSKHHLYADPLFQQHQAFCQDTLLLMKEAEVICSQHKRLTRILDNWQKQVALTSQNGSEVYQDIKMLACTEAQASQLLRGLGERTQKAEQGLKSLTENHGQAMGSLGRLHSMNKQLDFNIDMIREEIRKDVELANEAIARCESASTCRSGKQYEALIRRKQSLAIDSKQVLEACQRLNLRVDLKLEEIPELRSDIEELARGMSKLGQESEKRSIELKRMGDTTAANIRGLATARADPSSMQCSLGPPGPKERPENFKEDGRIPPIFDHNNRFPEGLDHAKARGDNQKEEGGYDLDSLYYGDMVKGGTQAGVAAFNCPKVPKLGGGSYGDPECVGVLLPEEVDRFWDNYHAPYRKFDDHNRPLIYSHCSTSGHNKCNEIINSIVGNEADGKVLTENTLTKYREYIASKGTESFSKEYVNREAARQVGRGLDKIEEGNISFGVALINVAGRLCRKHYEVYGVWEKNCPAGGGSTYVPAE